MERDLLGSPLASLLGSPLASLLAGAMTPARRRPVTGAARRRESGLGSPAQRRRTEAVMDATMAWAGNPGKGIGFRGEIR
jgi:hypothetical protein